MNSFPLFSIITISYNSVKTIESTIKSVLDQSFKDFEYIIIDGGSTDGTIDIIKKYQPFFLDKLFWISEKDSGIYNAMNKGILFSKGMIVGIVNSDDFLENDALENVFNSFNENNKSLNSIYTGDVNFIYNNNVKHVMKSNINKHNYLMKNFFSIAINHPATFVPMNVYNRIGLFDENIRISSDSDFLYRCYVNKIPIVCLDKVLTNMRNGGTSNNMINYKIIRNDYLIRLNKYCNSWFNKMLLIIRIDIILFIKKYINGKVLYCARFLKNLRYD